ncbi:MAG: hypothetical protein CM15mV11_0280 [Caudoviricetes sp.]|nr:MAG: hypothetical protein CM15mV11_0280 [Caudoviricetes sp.]
MVSNKQCLTNTFDVNVGTSSNTTTHTFQYALPNSMVRSGETLRLSKDAVSFKCSQDNFKTIHSYPRTDDLVIIHHSQSGLMVHL